MSMMGRGVGRGFTALRKYLTQWAKVGMGARRGIAQAVAQRGGGDIDKCLLLDRAAGTTRTVAGVGGVAVWRPVAQPPNPLVAFTSHRALFAGFGCGDHALVEGGRSDFWVEAGGATGSAVGSKQVHVVASGFSKCRKSAKGTGVDHGAIASTGTGLQLA